MSKVLERIQDNAAHLSTQYSTSSQLLGAAMQDAMPWAMNYATRGVVPRLDQLEKLCTQLLAIVMASSKDSPTNDPAPAARVVSFGERSN